MRIHTLHNVLFRDIYVFNNVYHSGAEVYTGIYNSSSSCSD